MVRFWDAVASAGPYANNLHLAPDTTTPTPHHSIFTGRMLFLTSKQQCKITEDTARNNNITKRYNFGCNISHICTSTYPTVDIPTLLTLRCHTLQNWKNKQFNTIITVYNSSKKTFSNRLPKAAPDSSKQRGAKNSFRGAHGERRTREGGQWVSPSAADYGVLVL